MIWSSASSSSSRASRERLLAGVEAKDGAAESAWRVLGEDSAEESDESDGGASLDEKLVVLLDLDGDLE